LSNLAAQLSDATAFEEKLVESFAPLPLRFGDAYDGPPVPRKMALLWLDVVGFTKIGHSLVEAGPAGIEQLADLLDRHFDGLLGRIVAHGGLPLLFAGDGLLSGWPVEGTDDREATLRAAACGEEILGVAGTALPSGETLSLHATLAFGPCLTTTVGDSDPLPITVGAGLADLQATTGVRAEGRLLVSPSARAVLGETVELGSSASGATVIVSLRDAPSPRPLVLPRPSPKLREQLAALTPLPIAQRLDRRHIGWTAELRRVAVAFTSLAGLDHASPDALRRLEDAVRAIGPMLRKQEGFPLQLRVDEHGTEIIVVFGVPPLAHADYSGRAIRCAMQIKDALRAIGQRSSIAVTTGRVFCGLIGNDIFRAWTIYGEPINLASRLQNLQLGNILCDEATVRAARDRICFSPAGASQVCGMGLSVSVWTPERQERIEIGPHLVGRDRELSLLLEWLALARGTAQIVMLEGESGIGKSRLLEELRQQAAARGTRVVAGQADRIEQRMPYRALRSALVQLLRIDPLAPIAARRERVLSSLGPELAPQAGLLTSVLEVDLPESENTRELEPMQRPKHQLALLSALLQRAAAERPLLMTLDDAQWLDDESWSLVKFGAANAPGLCIVLAMQPLDEDSRRQEFVAAGAHVLRLEGLAEEDQERLALSHLGVERIEPALSALLRERARGHPFFCLQLALALRDEGVVEINDGVCRIALGVDLERLPLPDTVHAAVTRRIDRLDLPSQITLKVASAAGHRFPTAMVANVHPSASEDHEAILRHLDLHQRAGLLRPERVDELDGYAFSHGIVRDVAYDLMLYVQRRDLHRRIGEWYERTRGNTTDTTQIAAVLAYHFEHAGDTNRAVSYHTLEAERLFRLGNVRQSLAVGLHAARLLGADIPKNVGDLQKATGRQMEQISSLLGGRSPEDLVDLPPLKDAQAMVLIPLLLSIAPYAYQSQRPDLFALLAAMCLKLTLEKGQAAFSSEVYSTFATVQAAMTGNRRGAAAWSKLGLLLQGDRRGASFARCAFVHVWFHNHWTSTFEEGIALARAGAEAGLAHGEIPFGCFNLTACVALLVAAGRSIDEVTAAAEKNLARNGGRVRNSYFNAWLELQSARALAGQTRAFDSLSDNERDEDVEFARMHEANFSNQVACYYVAKLRIAALGGDWRGSLHWAERARSLLPAFAGQLAEVTLVHFQGLAALAVAAFDAPDEALQALGWDCAERLRQWEPLNSAWLGPKADMLEGLLEMIAGRGAQAQALLRRAAQRAAAADHLEDRSLALEFLARAQRAGGEGPLDIFDALAADELWGAKGKRARLAREFGVSA
jgi:predicted ATPase/class 3 adenylate cyclase